MAPETINSDICFLTFSGSVFASELQLQYKETIKEFKNQFLSHFGIIVDMNNMYPLGPAARIIHIDNQKICKESGMNRSAFLINSFIVEEQLIFMAMQSGTSKMERYIYSSQFINPIEVAMLWVKDGIDPTEKNNPLNL